MSSSDWIPVGRLRRARGLRGELLGEIYSNREGRADALKQVVLELQGKRREAQIEEIWLHGGVPVFKFAGIDSISEAEPWQGADILVAPDQGLQPEEGEYTHAGLIGCSIVDESGTSLGVVTGVEEFGGPPLLKVNAVEGLLRSGREILIPFAKAICTEIDVPGKLIRVKLPEGLTDL